MRTIVFGTRRTVAIKEAARTVELVESPRTCVVRDVCRTVSFTVPQRRLTINREPERAVTFVRPVRTITVVQGRAGRDGEDGQGSEPFPSIVAGELITSSSLTHISEADGLLYLADYELDRPANSFTISGCAMGASLAPKRLGLLNGLAGIVPGKPYWLGNLGQLRATMPDHGITQRCGDGASDTEVMVSIFEDVVWE